jgi:hypothetical protein
MAGVQADLPLHDLCADSERGGRIYRAPGAVPASWRGGFCLTRKHVC